MFTTLIMLIDSPEEQSRFEELYNEYERLMFFIARKKLGSNQLAEDAVNDAFIRIIKHFDEIEQIACPRTKRYVVVIIRNICNDMYAKAKRSPEIYSDDFLEVLENTELHGTLSSEDSFFQRYDMALIQQALSALTEEARNILYLSVVCEKSRNEISELTGLKTETVKKRLYRARKELRKLLEVYDAK